MEIFYNFIVYPYSDFSRRSSYDVGDGCRESEVVLLKERRLVPIEPVRQGMLRFSFLLETCTPGSVPDPQLVAAVLDLVRKRSRFDKESGRILDYLLLGIHNIHSYLPIQSTRNVLTTFIDRTQYITFD